MPSSAVIQMNEALLRAILILPGTVLVAVPAGILLLTRSAALSWELTGPSRPQFWLALLLFAGGAWLMVRTVLNFTRIGQGTPAPWDPPRALVVRGVYRHVRNPMISGVICVLLAEALVFQSLPLLVWAAIFIAANMVYIPIFEEPGLERRFGEPYRIYKANVPRWLPRLTPWKGGDAA